MTANKCPACGADLSTLTPEEVVVHLRDHLDNLHPEVADEDQLLLEIEETKRKEHSLDEGPESEEEMGTPSNR